MKQFVPQPLDTTGVELPESLHDLIEKMAENVHNVWALSRINEGWRWGESRNDALKLHPCLVPYSELPEIEKEYDRNTALETLRFIIKSGFSISKEK